MAVLHPNTPQEFDDIVQHHKYLLIDFSAAWCGPCKAIAPLFEKLASEHGVPGRLAFVKVDVDQVAPVAQQFGVTAMPTFNFMQDSQIITLDGNEHIRGANARALIAAAEKLAVLAKA